jgi:hypothetical protein
LADITTSSADAPRLQQQPLCQNVIAATPPVMFNKIASSRCMFLEVALLAFSLLLQYNKLV